MFELWKLKRLRKNVFTDYEKRVAKLLKADPPKAWALMAEEYQEVQSLDDRIDVMMSEAIRWEAKELDVEVPPVDNGEMWKRDQLNFLYLTPKGRSHLRRLIDEEKTRRFDVWAKWVKLLLPIITAVAGLIGVITGLVAVLRK